MSNDIMKNNAERFNGFADTYHMYRPTPPKEIIEALINYIQKKPNLVVDLGCGTGLSTCIWNNHADRVIGIDPNGDMLSKAREVAFDNIEYKLGYGHETGVECNSVDIVTCSSSFQWMEPESTIREVSRILKNGGVYAIYNHNNPPTFNWEAEKAYKDLFNKVYTILDEEREKENKDKLWNISEYMNIIKREGFRFTKEIYIHKRSKINSDDFIGFAMSQGGLQKVKKMGLGSIDEDIEIFNNNIQKTMGNKEYDAIASYILRVAIK